VGGLRHAAARRICSLAYATWHYPAIPTSVILALAPRLNPARPDTDSMAAGAPPMPLLRAQRPGPGRAAPRGWRPHWRTMVNLTRYARLASRTLRRLLTGRWAVAAVSVHRPVRLCSGAPARWTVTPYTSAVDEPSLLLPADLWALVPAQAQAPLLDRFAALHAESQVQQARIRDLVAPFGQNGANCSRPPATEPPHAAVRPSWVRCPHCSARLHWE
jgi:hypothetical protein